MGIVKIHHGKSGFSSSCSNVSYSSNCEGKGTRDDPVLGGETGEDFDDSDLTETCCELGMVEGKICSIPYELYDLPDLRDILSLETWNSCLTEEERFSLSAFLPDMDQPTFWLTLKELLSGGNMHFGNPMDTFFRQLKGGFYPPKVACLREFLQFLQRRKHYHSLRSYHDKMAQMFMDMKKLWDQCDMSTGIEERLSIWRMRGRRRDINLLDLNKVPKEGYPPGEEVNADATVLPSSKRMKILERVRANAHFSSLSVNGVNFVAPNCSTRGVLKVKSSGNCSAPNHNQKIVTGDSVEPFRSIPKGLLKVVPKFSSVQMNQPKVYSRRSHSALLAGAEGSQDCRLSSLPTSTYLVNARGFGGSSFQWEKIGGNNEEDGPLRGSRYLESSDNGTHRNVRVDDTDLGKCKLFGHDVEMGSDKNYESLMGMIGAKRYQFGGQNLWKHIDVGNKGLPERPLDRYPFVTQINEGQQQTRDMRKEHHFIVHPQFPEGVSGNTDIGVGTQEMRVPLSDQRKKPSDVNVENTENLSSKPSVSRGLKDDFMLPLTYKRRKPQAKA